MGDAADDAERRAENEQNDTVETLVEKFYGIVDGYYSQSEDFTEVEQALERYEEIFKAVRTSSLALDGWEMIQAAMRGDD